MGKRRTVYKRGYIDTSIVIEEKKNKKKNLPGMRHLVFHIRDSDDGIFLPMMIIIIIIIRCCRRRS
jgi:hypothetical protein